MNRIKELRKKRKITQIRLSIAAEVSQETISAYENGKAEPKMDKLIKIADFFKTGLGIFYCSILNICLLCFPYANLAKILGAASGSIKAFSKFYNVTTDYLLERTNNDAPLSDLTNKVVDEQLNELINNYARLNNLQRKDLIWYSGIIEQKDLK